MGGVEMDTQSCIDHSILAIFEDSSVSSEYKSGAEEESETLLSALTEMLDSVEDDDETLSPFNTLPDTKLLAHPERRDTSVELLLADRLRPRSKSPSVTFTMKINGEKEDESKLGRTSPQQLFKQQSQTLFHSTNKKADAEVFTSTYLVNLVKLMHPYCLKLHVEEEEEGDELRENHTVFSQEEVWKYERPSEDSDEEINVVSDDEVTVDDPKEEEEEAEKSYNILLKSVLLNGNISRTPPPTEKKQVSFGSVQVASFESTEKGSMESNLTTGPTSETASVPLNSSDALDTPAGSALEPQALPSEMSSDKTSALPLRGETKVKSLSLQQYRQLRQKRLPLVEKERNYTTMWPCVSEAPTELTPILCLQGQRPNSCAPNEAHRLPDGRRSGADPLHLSQTPGHKTHCVSAPPTPHPPQPKPSTRPQRSGLKHSRTESKMVSSANLQPKVTANPNVTTHESKKSPVKKPTLLSSDPPNPVLLPRPVSQTTSPAADPSSSLSKSKVEFLNRDSNRDDTRHFPEMLNESSGTSLQRQPASSGPTPEVLLVNQRCTTLQEFKQRLAEIASGVSAGPPARCQTATRIKSASECKELQPRGCSSTSTREEAQLQPKSAPSPGPDTVRRIKCPSIAGPVDSPEPVEGRWSEGHLSGSTSEEPTATLQLVCREPSATADSGIEAPDLTSLLEQFEETQAKEENEPESKLAPSQSNLRTASALTQRASVETLEPLSTSESPGSPATVGRSPPLGTDIVLSAQQDPPARRRTPPSKAIQIIDPRPLPSKKAHGGPPAAHIPPRVYSSVSSDHDYCASADRSVTGAAQRSRASKPKDVSQTSDEDQVATHDSSAAAECKNPTSACELGDAVGAVLSSAATQRLAERPGTRSETSPAAAVVPTAPRRVRAAEDETVSCTLPTPPPSPPARGREKRRYRRRSPRSDSSSSSLSSSSSSSSASPSPKRQKRRHKRRHKRSESSSCSSSSPSRSISGSPSRRYRWSYSRSSRSWSQSRSTSRSRSPSTRVCRRQWADVYRESRKLRREHEIRIQKLKAIDERRVVYVGRIRRSMTHDELRERFSQFGVVECVSLHFRERGDHYGFVTFYNTDDAFAAIDNGGKLRKPDELPFDICFGGRRQFCNSHYADLDANRDAEPAPAKPRSEDLDFDSLLKQAQRGLKR
ncbi:peroxisome proliferator-activated receptor gamma coactivator-related protein 1-like isoform X2 [Pseudoliparis swirei]|uniref:peroxisome proliferator-activated receptor gamma coactivator-related protein 1-like isoform X2 n=1 Tax=Pseudoliparis swirei TaxID=2059687 RepID=UPI0024BE7255|nr:peroxisome proliferator-activated receptor gamma coactivator-related protein 1-like isoform X2 [Pseudoliparis swirei]